MVKLPGYSDAIILLALIWLVSCLAFVFPAINLLGITPRSVQGLIGVPFSLLVHGSIFHLLSNSISLFILMILLSYSQSRGKFWQIVALGTLGSGALTWLFSSGGLVVGASGLSFALIGFLLANSVFNPSFRSVPVGIVTLLAFGGSVLSLYHFSPHISLAAHAGGIVTGIALAKLVGSDSART